MQTGKGLLHRRPSEGSSSEISFTGFVSWDGEKRTASATVDLQNDPVPALKIAVQGLEISGFLEMNSAQQSRAEPDLMNFIEVDGFKYAAGVWIPRQKQKRCWVLVFLRPADPSNHIVQIPRNRPHPS